MRITVAEIVNTHGIRGNLKVKSLSDNEKRFKNGAKLFIEDETLTVESSFDKKGFKVIKFAEYDDINDVQKFIGKDLTVEDTDLEELSEDEYYVFELVGLDVYDSGQKVGTISDVVTGTYPNDVYIIETENGEVWFPALNATVDKINLDDGLIEVNNFKDYE